MSVRRTPIIDLLLAVAVFGHAHAQSSEPVAVNLVQSGDAWALHRADQPFRIRGAGGTASLERLAKLGANF